MSSMRLKTALYLINGTYKYYKKNYPVPAINISLSCIYRIVLCRDTCVHYNICYAEKKWDDSLTFKLFQLKLDIILFLFLFFSFSAPFLLFFYSFTQLFFAYSFSHLSVIYIPSPHLSDRFACHSGIMETGK